MSYSETFLQNDDATIKFRRNSRTLADLGTGIIVFGFWSIIKLATYLILNIPIYDLSEIEDMDQSDLPIVMGMLYVMLAIDVVVRLIVGLNARAEGRGRKRSSLYLIFNVWLILFGLFSVGSVIWECFESIMTESFFDYLLTLFMECSSLAITIEVYIAALSVRRYKLKELRRRYQLRAG
jgi:hypothetical protein